MASSPPIDEQSNGDTITTSAVAVTSPATPAAVNSDENLTKTPNKKPKLESSSDHRKEREEWTASEITILLEAFTEKYLALNRTNLPRKEWEVVTGLVAECSDKRSRKGVEQCKNKIDNLKKRYKLETQRVESNGGGESKWIWFKRMDCVFGVGHVKTNANANVSEAVSDGEEEEDYEGEGKSAGVSSANRIRRSARLAPHNGSIMNKKLSTNVKWKRVVFKVSGSALAGSGQSIDPKVALQIAEEVATASRYGVEVAIIIGGRNFFCGDSWVSATDLDRPTAYQIGMMATVMNSILLQSALQKLGIPTRVQSAFVMPEVAEPYNRLRAMRHLDKGRVVIFGGIGAGTGNPLFTTDAAAALRASEINANAVIKGTNVNGIYDNNVTLDKISFRDVASKQCTSFDLMAIQLCEENAVSVVVFNMLKPGNVSKALTGKQVGTLIEK
ncbi:uncharacterized protein LOC143627352 [Bidens hawaiensis]|uniref:uncharacterized protein LOC143627352 n=1 Tax=Bidens hawaiensis TaxID=980011 RepID=UPI00404B2B2C